MNRSPADLAITPRDRRFGRGTMPDKWWLANDPIATAFYNALSAVFPIGEAFFVDSVRRFREGAEPRLAAEIAAFTKQEVMHTREHAAFNRQLDDAGYDVAPLEQRVAWRVALVREKGPYAALAATMALEHWTAMLAQQLLSDPRHLAGGSAAVAALWRWHAIEEIEHKGVAYDTWLHATNGWSRWKRWKVKSLVMLLASRNFVQDRSAGMTELLRQDGLTGRRVALRLAWYAFARPGLVRRILISWLAYFMPGFHPWRHDDRALIAAADRALATHDTKPTAAAA